MYKLGEIQNLKICKKVDFGVYLTDEESEDRVLLPKKQVPEGASIGDSIEVFLYKDSEDRMIATNDVKTCIAFNNMNNRSINEIKRKCQELGITSDDDYMLTEDEIVELDNATYDDEELDDIDEDIDLDEGGEF